MAVPQSLLQNLVANAQLQQQESLRARKMRELAKAAPRGQAARIAAPRPIVQQPNRGIGQGLSALGKALGDIGQMKKERAAKDAFAKMYEPTMVTDDMGGATAMPTTPKARALMNFAVRNAGTKTGASALQAAQFAMQAENQAATRENQLALKRMEMQQKNLPKNATAAFLTKVDKNLGAMVSGNEIDPKIAMSIAQNPAALKLFKGGKVAEALQQANVEIDKIKTLNIDGVNKEVGFTKTGSPIILGDAQKVAGRDVTLPDEVQKQKVEVAAAQVMAKGKVAQQLKQLDKSQKSIYALQTIDEAMAVLNSGEATGSVIGNVFDNLAAVIGVSTEGARATSQLKLLQATLMLQQPRMEGPQSDRDVILYRDAAAQIGDPNTPVPTRIEALKTLKRLHKKYAPKDIGDGTQTVSSSEPPPPPGFVPVQ